MKELTQKQRILNLLKERGEEGVYVYEIMTPRPRGLGIAQYRARILELRRKDDKMINKEPGHFVLDPDYSDVPLSERDYETVIGDDNIARKVYV